MRVMPRVCECIWDSSLYGVGARLDGGEDARGRLIFDAYEKGKGEVCEMEREKSSSALIEACGIYSVAVLH